MPDSEMKQKSKRVTEEYRVLHRVAQILQAQGDLIGMLQSVMRELTAFQDLKVENKAGIFLANNKIRTLELFTTYGEFSEEFLLKEKEVPFGDCLCGRVAESGELLMSENCFQDPRHERLYDDMTAHGHYIVPLKTGEELVGVLFLYTRTHPTWYQDSREVLYSIGGLIAEAIQKKRVDLELSAYRDQLESLVEARASELKRTNEKLISEIEEHKETQVQLERSRDQFRNLGNQIQAIREEEKSRIAREVHDRLGQALTALKIDTIQIGKKLPPELDGLKAEVDGMTEVIDDTIRSVQHIAMELRPPILDAFGICEAIAWQAGEYEQRYGLQFDVHCLQETADLDKGLETTLFRIFQEAVSNVVRHAGATRVAVDLSVQGGDLVFKIEDDGRGIRQEDIENAGSLGLVGIQERVHPFRGNVEFLGQPGKGTTVAVTIPLSVK